MAGLNLSDIIKQVSAGGQAAREAERSGGTFSQMRSAALNAIEGAKAASAAQPQFVYPEPQESEPVQTTAPGMEATDSGEEKEADDSSFVEDRKNKREKRVSHDFDALRDYGGLVPIIGPGLSYIGSLGNVLTSAYEDNPNATSNAREAVESGNYIADPRSLAMPDVSDIRTAFTDDEAFNQYLANTAAPIDSFVAEAFLPGVGSAVSKAVSKTPKAAAKAGEEYGKMMVEDAVKTGDKASGVLKSAENKGVINDFIDELMGSYPKELQDYIYSSMPYGTRAGKLAGVQEAGKMYPAVKALQQAADNATLIGQFAGNTIPRLLRPAMKEAAIDEPDGVSEGPRNDGSEDNGNLLKSLINGLDLAKTEAGEKGDVSPDLVDQVKQSVGNSGEIVGNTANPNGLSQDQSAQYAEFLASDAGRQLLSDLGYDVDFFSGDQGYYNFLSSMDKDLAYQLINAIPTWDARYMGAGVDITDPEDIYRYMWLQNPVLASDVYGTDAYDWMSHGMSSADLAYILPYLDNGRNYGEWDANDIAQFLYMTGVTNGTIGFDLDAYNKLARAAGEGYEIGYTDDDSSFKETDRKNARDRYSIVNPEFTPYGDQLMDQYFIDTALAEAEKSSGKKAGVRGY